jgi:hypothetical protein
MEHYTSQGLISPDISACFVCSHLIILVLKIFG